MADKAIRLIDTSDQTPVPVAYHDNGDGTYSLQVYDPASGAAGESAIGGMSDAPVDAVESAADRTVISLLKGAKNYLRSIAAAVAGILVVRTDQTTPGTTDKVTVATATGAGATIGVITGAAVITDADGTIQQYLRGLVKLIVAKITVTLGAGTALVGKFGIDQATLNANEVVVKSGTIAALGGGLPAAFGAGGGVKVDGSGTALPVSGTVSADAKASIAAVYNVSMTLADTEYSQVLPANCRGFEFQCRSAFAIRWQVVTGKVATPTAPWMTLKSGDAYSSPSIAQAASPSTLYFGCDDAAQIVELLAWT